MDSPPHKQARCTISTMSPNSKPRRRESAQTKLWLLPGDHLPHHPRRHRSQQNSISKMSGRNKISRNRRRAQNGQPVGRSRTQPRPSFQNPRLRQSRNQINRRPPQLLDRLRHRPLIESRFLGRRADHHAPIAPRNQINLWSPHHMPHHFLFRHDDAQHLPLNRPSRERVRRNQPPPSASAIHHHARRKSSLVSTDAARLAVSHFHAQYLVA